ncbi:MAG: hypothetical protein HYY93_08055 [Planctomycetes bacterium]|nr:hypothetical protein [Planctomycetota bacterium]
MSMPRRKAKKPLSPAAMKKTRGGAVAPLAAILMGAKAADSAGYAIDMGMVSTARTGLQNEANPADLAGRPGGRK